MKHKFFKFLTPILLFVGLGISPNAWAWDWENSPRIYFDNSVTNYSNVTIILGNDGHSDCTQLSNIDNTKLYTGTPNYGGMNDGYFLDCSGWGSEYNKPYNRRSSASHYTGNNYIQENYDGSSSSTNYVFVPQSNSNGCTLDRFQITYSSSTPTTLNKTITIEAKVDGTATNAPGKLTASSYTFSAYATCGTSSSATLDAGSSSTTCTVGYTANTTLTAVDVVGYTFDGWYNGSTKISSDKSCTVNPIGGETYYAAYTAIKYYLKKSNGSSEGTKIGTFTQTSIGTYTYTWTSNTSSKAYFYVSLSEGNATDNANFLGGAELTDGSEKQVWLYQYGSGKWGDAQYISSPYDGVDYVFTFTITNDGTGDEYHIKCDYPKLYTGLSVTKTPVSSASDPTISKNYVTQGQFVTVTAQMPNTGYRFDGWTSDNGEFGTMSNLQTTFTPDANNAVATANYSLINYTITYDPKTPANFAYTAAPTSETYGQLVEMTFTPATNYVIASVTAYKTGDKNTKVAVARDGETNNYSFTQPAYDVTVQVEVSLSSVQVTYGTVGNGSIIGKINDDQIGDSPADVPGGSTVVFTATPDHNYTVEGWYNNEGCTGDKLQQGDNTGNAQTYTIENIAEAKTVYVKFKETTYSVTIDKGTGISSVTPSGEQQVGNVTEKTVTATLTPGYTIADWTYTGGINIVSGQGTNSISIKATADGTITANATENMTTITVTSEDDNKGTVSSSKSSVGVTTSSEISATPEYGYKFKEWQVTEGEDNIQITSSSSASTIVKGTGTAGTTATIKAVFVEDLSTGWYLRGNFTTHDDNDPMWGEEGQREFMKKVGESTDHVAYVTMTNLSANTTYAYKYYKDGWKGQTGEGVIPAHAEWTLDGDKNVFVTTSLAGDYTFKIDFNETNPKSVVIYPDVQAVTASWNGWTQTSNATYNNGVLTANIEITQETINQENLKFKIICRGVYYGATIEGNQMTADNHTDWDLTGTYDINFKPTTPATYVFTFTESTKKLTVSYPSEASRIVIVDNGESVEQKDVQAFATTAISAPHYLNGKRFAKWIAVNSSGVEEDDIITINNPSSYNGATINGPTKDGITVRATYTTENMVYFKNTPGWGDVSVFFYNQQYYDEKMGTGTRIYIDDKDEWVNDVALGYPMTRLNEKSDIWYYDYSSVDNGHKTGTIAFNDHNDQNGYQYFNNCQASYRTDWNYTQNLSVFVPEKNITERKNENRVPYYNKGYWMKYDDLKTGYYLRVKDKTESGTEYEFKAASAGAPYKATITLEGSQTKEFWINGVNGSSYKNAGTMTSSGSHSGWEFYEGNQDNCKITTTSAGDYTFTLTFGEGMLLVSVEYPLSENDYRVVYTDNNHLKGHPSTFIRKGDGNKDIVSFFIDKDKNPALKFQYCSKIEGSTVTWTDVDGGTIDISGITETGIYNFNLEQDANSISCTGHELYDGDFYIRTAIAAGGWDAYKGSDDNLLPYIEYGLDESQPFKFTHAYTNWVEKDKNVKFCIANDYSLCISDTLVGDDIIGKKDNADWLKNGANIRFMWNKNTNALSRAYISGSTNDEDRFLMLVGDVNMFDDKGVALPNNELKFTDKNNWVYQADIKAKPGCAVKLTAQYTIGSETHTQYFMGTESTTRTIISGSATDKQYTMRVVYDFKTNRLTAGWVPDGTEISSEIILGGDMLLVREHQGDANQITFSGSGQVSDIHHIYGVLTLKKDSMAGTAKEEYKDKATNANYGKTMYWISFPFDVNISEIFGVDGYGKKWIMQKYNGQRRADIGWFAETSTFWEYMDISEKLNAYEGYLFIVDANYFNTTDADVWKNSATEANFYFPSTEKNIGIINMDSKTISVPAHPCGIDVEFDVAGVGTVNHKNTDSHWNVIGVPAFQDKTMALSETDVDTKMKAIYQWNSTNNSYNVIALKTDFEFQTMHAYMVQYSGDITWSNVSVVNNPTTAPYRYADDKNYMIELFFNGNGAEDHTYINLADGASTDFVLNEDMMKIDNAGQPNIYSFAGAYDVAYNETTFDNQTVMLGVSAPKDGSYTFAMPKDFSGKAVLVDLETGEATDLNLSDYTVELNKGTYNNRFQLLLEVEAQSPTNMNPTKGEWSVDGKTKKLFINDNIYLINAGRIYNASGTQVK